MGLNNTIYQPPNSQELLLFDWELVHIEHPSCYFDQMHGDIPSELFDEYLAPWAPVEDLRRAREAYDMAWKVGWCMKMWSLLDCMIACNAHDLSATRWWWLHLVLHTYPGFRG